ncbi:MAG: F0F1 ATP synthase subunit A [Planctomycetaceae bacterium]|jgi:F-type H+-transporting ATPase subunit a
MASGHDDVFHHVRDFTFFEVPRFLTPDGSGHLHIPQPFGKLFTITKFMVIEVLVLVLAVLVFQGLARRVASGEPLRGRFWNFFEAILVFLRDEVVRPTIGDDHHGHGHDDHGAQGHGDHGHAAADHGDAGHSHAGHGHAVPATAASAAVGHPADKYLPYIWSVFFFVLFCNLLGAVPWLGSPTGNIWVTGVLAVFTLCMVIRAGTETSGFVGFWLSLIPTMDLPPALAILLKPLMWVIEFIGLIIKHGVLAVRLFANIMAGHTVIAVILGFIAQAGASQLVYLVAPASILGQVGIGLLELFVAFLQSYVFAYLSTLFIAAAKHPH